MHWKEVQEKGNESNNKWREVNDKMGRMLRENEYIKGRWSEYFEKLMNVSNQGKAIVTCMRMRESGG